MCVISKFELRNIVGSYMGPIYPFRLTSYSCMLSSYYYTIPLLESNFSTSSVMMRLNPLLIKYSCLQSTNGQTSNLFAINAIFYKRGAFLWLISSHDPSYSWANFFLDQSFKILVGYRCRALKCRCVDCFSDFLLVSNIHKWNHIAVDILVMFSKVKKFTKRHHITTVRQMHRLFVFQ